MRCRTSDFRVESRRCRPPSSRSVALRPRPRRRVRRQACHLAARLDRHRPAGRATQALARTTCATRAAACWRPAASSRTRWRPGSLPLLLAARLLHLRDDAPRARARPPGVRVLWLDAHADFNTPSTTPSGFLGGMCLAGACGVLGRRAWAPAFDPARVVMCGVRDVDAGERVLLDTRGRRARRSRPSQLAGRLGGPKRSSSTSTSTCSTRSMLPGTRFPRPAASSLEGLRALLGDVAARDRRRLRGHLLHGARGMPRARRAARRRSRAPRTSARGPGHERRDHARRRSCARSSRTCTRAAPGRGWAAARRRSPASTSRAS